MAGPGDTPAPPFLVSRVVPRLAARLAGPQYLLLEPFYSRLVGHQASDSKPFVGPPLTPPRRRHLLAVDTSHSSQSSPRTATAHGERCPRHARATSMTCVLPPLAILLQQSLQPGVMQASWLPAGRHRRARSPRPVARRASSLGTSGARPNRPRSRPADPRLLQGRPGKPPGPAHRQQPNQGRGRPARPGPPARRTGGILQACSPLLTALRCSSQERALVPFFDSSESTNTDFEPLQG